MTTLRLPEMVYTLRSLIDELTPLVEQSMTIGSTHHTRDSILRGHTNLKILSYSNYFVGGLFSYSVDNL